MRTDSAAAAVDQQRVPAAQSGAHDHIGPDGAGDFRQGCSDSQIHSLGRRKELCRRYCHLLGVSATGKQCAHFVADGPIGDTFAELADDAGAFESEDVARAGWRRVETLALQEVRTVDGGGGDVHQNVPARHFRIGLLRPGHDLGAAWLVDSGGVHGYDASESPQ